MGRGEQKILTPRVMKPSSLDLRGMTYTYIDVVIVAALDSTKPVRGKVKVGKIKMRLLSSSRIPQPRCPTNQHSVPTNLAPLWSIP